MAAEVGALWRRVLEARVQVQVQVLVPVQVQGTLPLGLTRVQLSPTHVSRWASGHAAAVCRVVRALPSVARTPPL